jgi:5-hmdU DNA kinase, helical domain
MRIKEFVEFIDARHDIYVRRFLHKESKPWTVDPILQQYRFCNVYRELDAVTQWIAKNWRTPHQTDPYLWFALTVARLFNRPETLAYIQYPVPFKPEEVYKRLNILQGMGKVFNPAYIVSTNGVSMDKIDYLLERVLEPLWKNREKVTEAIYDEEAGLAEIHAELTKHNGIGSFLGGQIIADLKYTPDFDGLVDWWTWAASGPGSRRGLNRVLGLPTRTPMSEEQWLKHVQKLTEIVNTANVLPERIHAQDLQNCLCEFDKYQRVRLGEGTPKQRYPGV